MSQKYIINGGKALKGDFTLSGAKNVALKALAATLLTKDEVVIHNVPRIADIHSMKDIVSSLGVQTEFTDRHTLSVHAHTISSHKVDLDKGARLRTSSMLIGPLLARLGEAIIPNPGGCRLGARPIDRHIEGLKHMGATIEYNPDDGYFYAKAEKLHGCTFRFEKNTHTGTETLLLAAVLAEGETVLENAALEPEVDDLILLLNSMGAKIKRKDHKKIVIQGVKSLSGATHTIIPDRNEAVTIAIAAYITGGDIDVIGARHDHLVHFFEKLDEAGCRWEKKSNEITRFYANGKLNPTDVTTFPEPGFMTDWQAPWSVLMTQADGVSTVHETVFEDRFSYVKELRKTGAKIEYFNPLVKNPKEFYNFNWEDNKEEYFHAIKITGPTNMHNAVMTISDIRAGATLVLAALGAKGNSTLHRVDLLNRGYEDLDQRLNAIGADITTVED